MVSARLLAVGIPRQERLHALSLLGLLLDHADAGGTVRVPLETIAGEFHLPRDQAEQALQALERVAAVRRGADGLVLFGRQPPASGGLRLAAFLANVATVLDEERVEPVSASRPHSPVLLADRQMAPEAPIVKSRRRAVRPRQPALAALAITGVVLLAALGSSSDSPTRLRTVAGPRPTSTDLAAPPEPGRVGPSGPSLGRSSSPPVPADGRVVDEGQPSSPSGPGAASGASGTARAESLRRTPAPETGRSAPSAASRAPASASASAGNQSPAPAPAPAAPDQAAPAPVAPAPASPGPDGPDPAISCPVRVPRIVVDSAIVRRAGPDLVLGVPTTSVVEVRGTLVNPTRAAAVIRSFEVILRSGADTVTVAGPPRPVTVAAGNQREWTVRTSETVDPASELTVEEATITGWAWQDAELDRTCPS